MSLTTVSIGLPVGIGDGRSRPVSNKRPSSTLLPGSGNTSGTPTLEKISSKMVVSNPPVPVPSSLPTTPAGVAATPTTGTPATGDSQPQQTAPARLGSRAYGKIVLTLENVTLPPEKLNPTPSVLDGLDPMMEMDLRIAGCELISSAGILLKLPQTAMATGQVLFQRFYYSKSFLRQDMELTAMACIYLASKIEEAPRRIRDVINVINHIKQLRAGKIIEPMCLDILYIRLKNEVTLAERRVLKELGFCVHVKHPHKLIVVYMQQLGCDKDSKFVQISWNYMSDALRTSVFVRYTPEAIACACIYLSARQLNIPLPTNPAWYTVFDVQEDQIVDICETILELYTRPKCDYISIGKRMSVLVQEFKASRQGQRAGTLSNAADTASPNSRPTSPNPESEESATNSGIVKVKDSLDLERPKDRDKRKNDGSDQSGRKSDNSPEPKKVRRSPSPITFNDSPQRHKKKKRKKSRSESSSPSRSRDRRSGKKHVRRERSRSRSPYSPKRQHHKKSKSHHNRDRYRSRSRSHSPIDRDERDRYDRGYDKQYYKKSSKSSKHPRDRDEDSISSKSRRNRSRDKDRR